MTRHIDISISLHLDSLVTWCVRTQMYTSPLQMWTIIVI